MSQSTLRRLPNGAAISYSRNNRLKPFLLHTELEFKDFWRSVIQLAFIVFMPVMFYVGFGFVFRDQAQQVRSIGELTITQGNYSYAGVLTFALLSVVLANVAISLAIKRHHGLFKRFRTTPVTPAAVMGAFLANALVTLAIVFAVISAIGVIWLGVDVASQRLPMLFAAALIGFVAIAPLGTALSLIPPNADAAVPIVNGVFFPLAFLSGAFFAMPFPEPVQAIINILPGKPLMDLFTAATAGTGPAWNVEAMMILLAWGLVGAVATGKWFKWASEREPRGFSQRKSAKDDNRD